MVPQFGLAEIHKVELMILKDIDNLCQKHKLNYCLYCGTLLGSIRHKGFIPWDDDADIMMPLRDCRRFLSIAKTELKGRYFISEIRSDANAMVPWTQIRREGTEYYPEEHRNIEYHKGISLDIYPLIGAYEGIFGKLQVSAIDVQRALTGRNMRRAENYKIIHRFVAARKIMDCMPRWFLLMANSLIEALFWPDPDKHVSCGTVDAAKFSGKYLVRDWKEKTDGEFEGSKFPIPKEYDLFLRTMYGDYWKLPPEEKRVSHHADSVVVTISDTIAEEIGIKP